MVTLIEELHSCKDYRLETFFLAVSLADRYLVYTAAAEDEKAPSLILLAVTCLLLAAKLEEHISPSY